MSYIYGLRGTGELTPLVTDLRQELYTSDYGSIDWNAARNQCAAEDLYYPHPWYQARLFRETVSFNSLGPSLVKRGWRLRLDAWLARAEIEWVSSDFVFCARDAFFATGGRDYKLDGAAQTSCCSCFCDDVSSHPPSLRSLTQDLLWWALYKAEPLLLGSSLRQKALAKAIEHIHYEVNSRHEANYQA